MTPTDLPDLVAQAYETACNPDGLATFIHDTARHFGARQSAVAIWSEKDPGTFLPITNGMADKDLKVMFDQRSLSGTLFEKLGNLSSGKTLVSKPPRQAAPAEGLSHQTDAMHLLAGLVFADGDSRCAIVLFREEEAGEFNQEEQESLQTLLKYYQRAVQLNNHFIQKFVEHKAALAALEFAPRGIIFVGQTGKVTYRNSAAGLFLDRKDGLRLRNGFIRINDSEARKKFKEFITNANSAAQVDSPDSMICKIPRESKAAAYQLIVTTMPFNSRRAMLNDDETLAIVVIHNPDDLIDLNAKHLRTFYELSRAEARLAQALYKHHSLAIAAESLDISINTARSELKNVFRKVGVKSQSALLVEFAKALKEG